ncbi:peptidase domain-containing ABC transporter [Alteromonas gilva]|uniref:Peptidase domain-containing ABC transporter n=1 Tax=Alteromonas gilva TaxID=2987522 RepID=A0ABT5L8V3_9ALTE|nr:peptidase domain-containing ABC transporter [Alteromonas gilva]MDC8832358.1 peptidase domain-containing ABC transporter [Alteromonas gilva]
MSHISAVKSPLQLGWRRRTPLILQAENSECGLACIAMIAGYHGLNVDLAQLRSCQSFSQQGANLKQLIDFAHSLKLNSRAVKVELEHLKDLQLPCILHWNMQHFVVLTKVGSKNIELHDPAIGQRKLSWLEADKCFTGIALELQPGNQFEPKNLTQPLKIRQLWQHIVGIKRSLIVIFTLSLLLQLFALASPYYLQLVIDTVIINNDKPLLNVLFLGFLLLVVIEAITNLSRQAAGIYMSSHLAQQLSVNVFTHLIRLPFNYFLQRHIGDLVARFGSLQEIRRFISQGIVGLILDSLILLCTLALMALYSVKLMCVVVIFSVIFLLLRLCLLAPIQRLQQEKIATAAKENSHFIETIRGIQSIRMLKLESFRLHGWQHLLTDTLNRDIQLRRWEMSFSIVHLILFGLENLIVIYMAAHLVMEQQFTIGMLYAFVSYKNRFNGATSGLVEQLIQWRLLRVHLDRLADIVHCPVAIESLPSQQATAPDLRIKAHRVSLKNVAFAYPGQPPLFQHINLHIEPGAMVVITGASGNGKSTLAKCLAGLMVPTQGQILIDDQPLNGRNSNQQISAVMQDDMCLSGSVIDNVSGFSQHIDMPRLIECCKLACLHDTINQLPMQYYTLISEGAANLSGGQRQRLYLARALYQQPALLLLDESSSHLDARCEHLINQNLSRLSMTRIVIAHRRETIQMAHQRYHLAGGCLTEVAINFTPDLPTPTAQQGNHYV